MLMPKRTKYRKHQRGRMCGAESRGVEVQFGDYGLQVLEPAETALAIAPKTEIHAKEAGVWLDLLPGLLAAGATILCPAAWLPFVTGAIRIGIPKIRALIEKEPARERWTLAQILALEGEVAALPDPQT